MADVIVYWGDDTWYAGNTPGSIREGKPAKVFIPFLNATETFQPEELDSVKPAPFYLDGEFITTDAKKIVQAANLFKLVKETLDSSLKLGGYKTIQLTDGFIFSRGDNKLEKSERFARLEIHWSLKQGIKMIATVVEKIGRPDQWAKTIWKGRYADTNPDRTKVLDLINQFIAEQEK